jgi:murein DD-endopeptidase MepM/ murein hydrolase activator NlpD
MTAERNASKGWGDHRPIPSVDLPLLFQERRAVRVRNAVGAGVVLLVVGGGAAAALFVPGLFGLERVSVIAVSPAGGPALAVAEDAGSAGSGSEQPPGSQGGAVERLDRAMQAVDEPVAGPVAEEAADSAPAPPGLSGRGRVKRRFGKASGFRDALRSAGLSGEEATELVKALEKLVDFRRCRPEDELTLERDASNRLAFFEYRVSAAESYRAARAKNGELRAERIAIPVETRRVAVGGAVKRSLGHALETAGLDRGFAGVFVEAFEGKADFKRQTREGDGFRLLVDKQYVKGAFVGYGEVSALEYRGQRTGNLRAFRFEPRKGRAEFFDEQGRAVQGRILRTPLRYDHISSPFNLRRKHPVLKRVIPHLGVDFAASPGTIVWAAADGTVQFAGERGANGLLVFLRHEGGYETFYAHLSRISRGIRKGARVSQRQPIGAVGSTGLSTGPHLHFALKRNGKFIDPEPILNGPGKPLPASEMPRFRRAQRRLAQELDAIRLPRLPRGKGEEGEPAAAEQIPQGREELDF